MFKSKSEVLRSWIGKSKQDVKAAEHLLTSKPPFSESALFFCQQSVEKAMKAFLIANDVRVRKIHDLNALGRECCIIDPTLQDAVDEVSSLSDYASEYRYPSDQLLPSVEEAEEALKSANSFHLTIVGKIEKFLELN